jgi:hypothetical protein
LLRNITCLQIKTRTKVFVPRNSQKGRWCIIQSRFLISAWIMPHQASLGETKTRLASPRMQAPTTLLTQLANTRQQVVPPEKKGVGEEQPAVSAKNSNESRCIFFPFVDKKWRDKKKNENYEITFSCSFLFSRIKSLDPQRVHKKNGNATARKHAVASACAGERVAVRCLANARPQATLGGAGASRDFFLTTGQTA